ncbi:hypothetical protein C4571_00620 [Candidatus Parcubacteria bacterium]|nr:MAG: hypothetical protein C4571_00620 [Candidatus Parcubacteria bacterium]
MDRRPLVLLCSSPRQFSLHDTTRSVAGEKIAFLSALGASEAFLLMRQFTFAAIIFRPGPEFGAVFLAQALKLSGKTPLIGVAYTPEERQVLADVTTNLVCECGRIAEALATIAA